MARMIPEAYPADTVSVAERKLFAALKDGLDDDFTVIHSLPWLDYSRRALQQGECDFVVLHPVFGMLAIETKSGEVSYDGPNRAWYRPDGSRLNKDPFEQAQQTVHYLNGFLRRDVPGWSQSSPPFGYAVVFPDADKLTGKLPPHVIPQIVILGAELANLQPKIEATLSHYRKPQSRMSRELYQQVIQRLLPEFNVVRSLSSQMTDQESGFTRLTSQQIRLLAAMRHCRRLLIQGCAGSGKTMLALDKALRLANEGCQVLLLCFNIPLANWLRQRAQEANTGVDVFHFHGLCEHVVRACGGEFQIPTESADQFWNLECAELLLQALPGYISRYEAVIVDEGQDFSSYWWIPVEAMLRDPSNGYLYIFHDPEQNIFRRENEYPFTEPTAILDVNCRNTQQIASYVSKLVGTTAYPAEFQIDGLAPMEYVVSSDEEELSEVSRILHQLLDIEQIDPLQIIILGRRRFENSPFARASPLDGIEIVNEADGSQNSAAVRYATIYRFKGLEVDCAILTGFRRPEESRESRELYVAASRGKKLLYVIYRE